MYILCQPHNLHTLSYFWHRLFQKIFYKVCVSLAMEYFIPTFKHGFCSINIKWSPLTGMHPWVCKKELGVILKIRKHKSGIVHLLGSTSPWRQIEEVFKIFVHGLRREPWHEGNGMDEAAILLRLNLIKPPITRHPGSGKWQSLGPWVVTATCECQPGQLFSAAGLTWAEQKKRLWAQTK